MGKEQIAALQTLFTSRLDTLLHLLAIAENHFAPEPDDLMRHRIAPDMLPFGTQIAFTCNQPRHFALWCRDQPATNQEPKVTSLAQAREQIAATKALLAAVTADDSKLAEIKRIELGEGLYLELPGNAYVSDFLLPNFYFHLTTAYAIMRMAGAPIGKRDYMLHLVPLLQQQA